MRIQPDNIYHLTYCTNIHPASGWPAVLANLQTYAPRLQQQLAPNRPFGLGLRISDQESAELLAGQALDELRHMLDQHKLYIALINGFPFGSFHGERVKEQVFAPDWRDERRVQYTLRLARILGALLPEGLDGGVSTMPLSYRRWLPPEDTQSWQLITHNLVRVAEALVRLRQQSGQLIHLDIEPEPDGLIESSTELVSFFQNWLLPSGAPQLARSLGLTLREAREALLEHVRVCWDTCHLAVGYEEPVETLRRFVAAGIKVGRLQISAALKMLLPRRQAEREELGRQLGPFAESTYLHQVVERRADGELRRYADLGPLLPRIVDPGALEWRTHFHVPLFVEQYGPFASTHQELRAALSLLRKYRFTNHLEIETYTWDVLPAPLKRELGESIEREYRWVLAELAADMPAALAQPG